MCKILSLTVNLVDRYLLCKYHILYCTRGVFKSSLELYLSPTYSSIHILVSMRAVIFSMQQQEYANTSVQRFYILNGTGGILRQEETKDG